MLAQRQNRLRIFPNTIFVLNLAGSLPNLSNRLIVLESLVFTGVVYLL